jgi:ABC-2 type transport system permease protein
MNLLKLIKLQLNVSFGLSAIRWYAKKDKKKILGGLGILLLVILSLAPIYFFAYLKLLQVLYEAGAQLGQPQLVLSLAMVIVSMFVLVFAIGLVMSMFYFSHDLPQLVPLPVKPAEIIGAKFIVILVQEYLTVIPMLLPAIIIFGLGEGAGLYYWAAATLVFLLAPVIPLSLVSAAILIMMRVTNLGRRKDLLRIAGMFSFIIVVMVLNYFANKLPVMSEEELVYYFLAENGLVNQIGRMFPPALIATRALTAQGLSALANLGAFLALNIGGIGLTLFLADRLFYRGLIGGDEISAGKKINSAQLDKKISRHSSPVKAIAVRELKLLVRTPIYMFNSVAMLLIVPVLLLIPSLTGGQSGLLDVLRNTDIRLYVNLGGAAIIGAMAIFTPAASSTFSREGKLFWISQVIPVSPQEQINGKLLYSLMIAALGIPLIMLFSVLGTRWSPAELAVVSILGMCLSFPAITVSLLIDLLRPYLTWDNPQKAIKQNLNVVIAMALGAGVFFILFRLLLALLDRSLGEMAVYLMIGGAALFIGAIPYTIMLRIAHDRYRDISAP